MAITSHEQIQVLHVDDEPSITDLTVTFLQRENDWFVVETATSADDGLERINDRPPDCVVSDYNMPGTDGLEFLQAVREEYPDLPFILFTGKGTEAVASDAISAGVTDYLQKGSGSEQYELLANRIENAVTTYRSQRVAQQRKERLELFFQESPLGAIQWDEDVRVERLNERAEDILGYDEAELRGKSWDTIVAADDRDRAGDTAAKLRAAEGGQYAVNRNLRNDGEMRIMEWHNRTVTDGDGAVQSVFSKFQDVTRRENRKRELEEYETIIESLSDAVYVLDEEGRFTYVNDEFVKLVGYDRERILESRPSLIKGEEGVEEAEHQLGRLLSSDGPETVTFEVTVEPCEGEHIVCEDHMGVLPYEGEEFNGSVGVLRNITERKERQEKFIQSERRLNALVQHSSEAIYIKDRDGEYRFINEVGADVFGKQPADIIGRTDHELFEAQSVEQLRKDDTKVVESDEPLTREVVRFVDNNKHVFIDNKFPYRDESGDVIGMMGVSRDITDRVEQERELRQKNDRLDEFASIVSHDLRNPLNVAQGRIELLVGDCDSKHLGPIVESLDRMEEIIADTLTLSKHGQIVSEFDPIELVNLVDACWKNVRTDEATIEIADEVTISGDRSRLQHVFENLFRNALEHGGPDVTVRVGQTDDDGIYVEDTGPGIPEDAREVVFDPGHTSTSGGTGIGLTIVKRIAEAHGWQVVVVDGTDGGARFKFTGVDLDQ